MMTIFVATVAVLSLSLYALMAIVPLMLESHLGNEVPDNVVHLSSRWRDQDDVRGAA